MENEKRIQVEGDLLIITLTRNGMTGVEWNNYFRSKCIPVHGNFKYALLSPEFIPGERGSVIEIAIMLPSMAVFGHRNSEAIYKKAEELSLVETSMEAACLLRVFLTNLELEKLELKNIAVMHKPLAYKKEELEILLSICNYGGFDCSTYWSNLKFNWGPETAHAFELKKV